MLFLWDWLNEQFIGAGIWVASGIYKVASLVFQIFVLLATGTLLDPDDYKLMVENFYVLLGVIMLFFLAFSLLKGMVNPDDQKKGTETVKKIIINLVSSSIILVLLPTIFSFAFDFQDAVILNQNTIGKFFGYGDQGAGNNQAIEQVKEGAYQIVNGVFTAFLNVNSEECQEFIDNNNLNNYSKAEQLLKCQEDQKSDDGDTFADVVSYVDRTGSYSMYHGFVEKINDGKLDFDFLLSIVAGALLIYVGVSFCFDMAVRLVKLVFYQLIAPVPLFMRVIPNNKFSDVFSKWVKVTITCYLEVFVRIIVFYFSLYLCKTLIDSPFLSSLYEYGWFVGLLSKAFVLMGIITFMRQAPKLLQEITGLDSGNMKLGIKDKLAQGGAFTAGAVLGSGATSLIRNATNAGSNIKNRWKQDKANNVSGWKMAGHAISGGVGLLKSTFAGGVAGAVRGGKNGWSAKSFGDMKKAASKGAKDTIEKRDKRANYKAAHGGNLIGVSTYVNDKGKSRLRITGVVGGHISDSLNTMKNYAMDESIEGLTRESNNMGEIASSYSKFSNGLEDVLKQEQAKGLGSAFLTEGFGLASYADFDEKAQELREIQGKVAVGAANKDQLRAAETAYNQALDKVRGELMDRVLAGTDDESYQALTAKGRSLLQDSMVNAESLQATILRNADSDVVQQVMGSEDNGGNGALEKIMAKKPLTSTDFEIIDPSDPDKKKKIKLKDAAKVAQGQADIKIAKMKKEKAAQGDSKK